MRKRRATRAVEMASRREGKGIGRIETETTIRGVDGSSSETIKVETVLGNRIEAAAG